MTKSTSWFARLVVVAAAISMTLLTACGSDEKAGQEKTNQENISQEDTSQNVVEANLTVALSLDGRTFRYKTIKCGENMEASDAAACAALSAPGGMEALLPVSGDAKCTEQILGPQLARVDGSVNSGVVHSRFSLANGCEIKRWNTLAALIGMEVPTTDSADITITVDPRNGDSAKSATLTCNPNGGTLSDASAACAVLLSSSGLAAIPAPSGDNKCTDNWEGPEVATIVGTINGEKINSTIYRADGCEIARWNALKVLFSF